MPDVKSKLHRCTKTARQESGAEGKPNSANHKPKNKQKLTRVPDMDGVLTSDERVTRST